MNADIAPCDFHGFSFFADAVDLKGDKAGLCHGVAEVSGGDTIDPCLDVVAYGADHDFVPCVFFECFLCFGVVFEVVKPATAAFIINASGPGAIGGVDFDLIAVDAAVLIIFERVGADLHTRVESRINFEFILEDEVAVDFFGGEEGVGCVGDGSADDGSVFDAVFCFAAEDVEGIECFAVKEWGEFEFAVVVGKGGDAEREEQACGE